MDQGCWFNNRGNKMNFLKEGFKLYREGGRKVEEEAKNIHDKKRGEVKKKGLYKK